MKIEILMLLESEMKGNNPTILNENEYEIENESEIDIEDDRVSVSVPKKKLNYLMKMMISHLNHLLINSKLLKWMIATLYAKHQNLH